MDNTVLEILGIVAIGTFLALLYSFTSAAIQRRRAVNTADEPYEAFIKDMAEVRPKPLKSLDYSPSFATPVFIEPPTVEVTMADGLPVRHYEWRPPFTADRPVGVKVSRGLSERDCE